jgi:hypothetical protein
VREATAAAIDECVGIARRRRMDEVLVTVASDLELQVDANGTATSAQFTPPLHPELQTCVANAIYKAKVEETGTVSVPIHFSY